MAKQVTFASRGRPPEAQAELPPQVALEAVAPKVPMKRLTFDIPADLHMRMKLECVRGGRDMADVIRELLVPNAATNLLHFLDASGTEKVMSSDLFRDHPATQQKYAEHMNKFLEGAKRRYDSRELKIGGPPVEMVWTDTANAFGFDYNDLGLAVGGYTLCSKASATAEDPKKVGMSPDYLWIRLDPWTVEAFDCYNWDPGKGIGLAFATDNDFCCLENAGRGKHFRVRTNPWPVSFQVQSVPLKATKPPPKPPPKSDDDKSSSSSR